MTDAKRTFEALSEASKQFSTEEFNTILDYIDETSVSSIRIENSVDGAKQETHEQSEDIPGGKVWLWQVSHGEDEHFGEVFIPLPDSRFLAFRFYT